MVLVSVILFFFFFGASGHILPNDPGARVRAWPREIRATFSGLDVHSAAVWRAFLASITSNIHWAMSAYWAISRRVVVRR